MEEFFRDSQLAWWDWDVAEDVVLFSELEAAMLGYDRHDSRTREFQAFIEAVHPDDRDRLVGALKTVLAGPAIMYCTDYKARAANGEFRWFMDRGVVLERNSEGRATKIRGIVIDLTREMRDGTRVDLLLSLFRKAIIRVDGTLDVIMTLCSECRKVRSEDGEWFPISSRMEHFIGSTVSHGMCPACLAAMFPDIAGSMPQRERKTNPL
jgi:hypothetical protein